MSLIPENTFLNLAMNLAMVDICDGKKFSNCRKPQQFFIGSRSTMDCLSLIWRRVKHNCIDVGSILQRQHALFVEMRILFLGCSWLSPQVHCPLSSGPASLNSLGSRQVAPSNISSGTIAGQFMPFEKLEPLVNDWQCCEEMGLDNL